jgi:hypothetical protein
MTPLKHFNENVQLFLNDLDNLFGAQDSEMRVIKAAFELTSVNARLFLKPFQHNIVSQTTFVNNILSNNIAYFIDFDFNTIINQNDTMCLRMFNKFKQATVDNRNNIPLVTAIFNWLKVMIYYAKLDLESTRPHPHQQPPPPQHPSTSTST